MQELIGFKKQEVVVANKYSSVIIQIEILETMEVETSFWIKFPDGLTVEYDSLTEALIATDNK